MNKHTLRLLYSFLGVLIIAVSVALSILANLGTDPFTTFNIGISNVLTIPFGTMMVVSNVIGLLLMLLAARHMVHLGTILSIVLVGPVSQFCVRFAETLPVDWDSLVIRIVLGIVGTLFLSIGAGLYITAQKGISPYDALPIILEEKANGRFSFQVIRIIIDLLAILIGFLLGATVGVITVISGFCMGPLIQFFRNQFEKRIEQ